VNETRDDSFLEVVLVVPSGANTRVSDIVDETVKGRVRRPVRRARRKASELVDV